MATNYTNPKFAFYHLLRRSTYYKTAYQKVDIIQLNTGTGTFTEQADISWSGGSAVIAASKVLGSFTYVKVGELTGSYPSADAAITSTGTSGYTYHSLDESASTVYEYQDNALYLADDYAGGAYLLGESSGTYGGTYVGKMPQWQFHYTIQKIDDPSYDASSQPIEFRPSFIPKSLLIAPGHLGLRGMNVQLVFQKYSGGVFSDAEYSSLEQIGTSVNTDDPIQVDFNWAADTKYENKNFLSINFSRRGETSGEDAWLWNHTAPSFTEILATRVVSPSRGPVANWQHTKDTNSVTLTSITGVTTSWVKGKSLRRWSLVYDKLTNNTGVANASTGEPPGWNLEPSNGVSGNGSDPYSDDWLVYDLLNGTGGGLNPFFFYPPNGDGWVLARLENALDVSNDFPSPGNKTTDSIRLDIVEVLG